MRLLSTDADQTKIRPTTSVMHASSFHSNELGSVEDESLTEGRDATEDLQVARFMECPRGSFIEYKHSITGTSNDSCCALGHLYLRHHRIRLEAPRKATEVTV